MARPSKYSSDEERRQADAERKRRAREEHVDPDLPVRDIEVEEPDSAERPIEVLLALDPLAPLTDSEEQLVRDWFGYGASEKRTRAEREEAAGRIREQAMPPSPEVEAALQQLKRQETQYLQKRQSYLDSLKAPTPSPSR